MSTDNNAPAGWYPVDGGQRYWNGAQWTADFRPDQMPAREAPPPASAVQPAHGHPGQKTESGAGEQTPGYGRPAEVQASSPAPEPGKSAPVAAAVGSPAATAKPAWYRRGWVIGTAALIVGIAIGAASAGGSSDPTTSQAYKDLSARLQQSKQQTADAKSQLQTVQGNLPSREAAVKKAEAQVKKDQAAVAAREKSVAKREKAVGIVEKRIAANTVPGTGMYKVGVDMKAGTYKTAGHNDCYYAVLNSSDTNDIATNNLTNGPGFVTVSVGQYFDAEGCADFILQQ